MKLLKILTKNLDHRKVVRKRCRIAVVSVLSVLSLLTILSFGVGEYLCLFAIKRTDSFNVNLDPGKTDSSQVSQADINREEFSKVTDPWLESIDPVEYTVKSDDNLNLKGHLYPSKEKSHNYAIILHGYRSTSASNVNLAYVYSQHFNFNCLLPDMRACGESEGDYLGMGYLDSKDVLKWIDLVEELDSECQILITGISMGGATTMFCSGLDLPDSVKCLVEDCGYTSVYDIFAHELDFLFSLPPFPFLYTASSLSSLQAGYSFLEADCREYVARSTLPMLFIHGEEDSFVLYEYMDELYNCKKEGRKEKLSVPGAGHGTSYLTDPQLYFGTVHDFIDDYFIIPEVK